MRGIKFRAWDKERHHMENEVSEIKFTGNLSEPYIVFVGWGAQLHDFELMQYTGLKDKNGREIYEGDLIDVGGPREVKFGPFYTYLENGLGGGYYVTGVYFMNADDVCVPIEGDDYQVIGNVHEHPELLNP